jgi:hypothetical protein
MFPEEQELTADDTELVALTYTVHCVKFVTFIIQPMHWSDNKSDIELD